MASRFSEQGGKEQNQIRIQFDVSRALSAIDDLLERIESLRSLGRLTDKESKEFSKLLRTMRGKIEKTMKKK